MSNQKIRARYRTNISLALCLLIFSLAGGMVGYYWFAQQSWIDAFLNAAMLLGGMGPVAELHSDSAKIFAGTYAIYCGVAFIATVGLVLAPVVLHVLHRFHLDKDK